MAAGNGIIFTVFQVIYYQKLVYLCHPRKMSVYKCSVMQLELFSLHPHFKIYHRHIIVSIVLCVRTRQTVWHPMIDMMKKFWWLDVGCFYLHFALKIACFISFYFITQVFVVATLVNAHGRLMNPPARNAMWRFGYPNKVNYDDNELYCGGYSGN